jgi:putative ATP-dependent endonuclease of OLD family
MLLRSLEVEHFRGLRHARLDFDETTALLGENGAGKSTLLDALAVCLGGRDDEVRLEARDFHHDERGNAVPALRLTLTFDPGAGGSWPADAPPVAPLISVAAGRRALTLHVHGTLDPRTGTASATWRFGDDPARGCPRTAPGLLAAWRAAHPILRLRANRYVEADPRGLHVPPVTAERDAVAAQFEQQIRHVHEALTGASDVSADDVRRGLEAAESYLRARRRLIGAAPALPPRGADDLAEAPLRTGRHPHALLSSIKQGAGVRGLALVALVGVMLDARRSQALDPGARPLLLLEDAEAHLHPLTLAAMWELIATLPAQKILTTNSGELLASVPLRSIRRITTTRLGTRVHGVDTEQYTLEDLRRIAYHVRVNRAGALFARCWLLVEGETEAWLLPELAQVCGYDFPAEGIRCVEFAQCGIRPLVRLASDFGIAWHLLADGDAAGHAYRATALAHADGCGAPERVTMLDEPDIEHCLFVHGYRFVYQALAGPPAADGRTQHARERATRTIARAIRSHSKPGLALAIVEAANTLGAPPVPAPLRQLIDTVVRLARACG